MRLPFPIRRLLLEADGREGTFDETNKHLVLDSLDALVETNDDFREAFPGYLAVGGNRGLKPTLLTSESSTGIRPWSGSTGTTTIRLS